MSLATYLVQRGKRGTWQLQVPIPRALHAAGKPKERIKSLGTTDRRIASDRALRVLDEWKREWAAARSEAVVGTEPLSAPAFRDIPRISEVALSIYEKALETFEDRRRQLSRDDKDQDAHIVKRQADLRRLARHTLDGDFSRWEDMADRVIETRGLPIERGSAEYDVLVRALSDASVEALRVFTRRHSGDIQATAENDMLVDERRTQAAKAKAGETLLELFDRYAEQRAAEAGKRADTLTQDRKALEQFANFVGADRAVTSIKPEHVRDYRDVMRQLPPKWRDRADMRGLTMREAAVKARAADLPSKNDGI